MKSSISSAYEGALKAACKRDINVIKNNNSSIVIKCRLNKQLVDLDIHCEKYYFQINIGNLLSIDKIEGQELDAADAEDIVGNLLDLIIGNKIKIKEHKILGLVAYSILLSSIEDGKNFPHTPYHSLSELVINKFGQELSVGVLHIC